MHRNQVNSATVTAPAKEGQVRRKVHACILFVTTQTLAALSCQLSPQTCEMVMVHWFKPIKVWWFMVVVKGRLHDCWLALCS